MAKQGFHHSTVPALIAQAARHGGWALCVGAGTSVPVFPSWPDLVRLLVAADPVASADQGLSDALLAEYGPDALLQASQDRLQLSDADFAVRLSECLYSGVRGKLTVDEFQTVCRVFREKDVSRLTKKEWKTFDAIANRFFRGTSADTIAQLVLQWAGTEMAPSEILSFNAEPLLYALVHAHVYAPFAARKASPHAGELSSILDRVTHSIASRVSGRIPYIFCHGLLSPPGAYRHKRHLKDSSTEKLVFSEAAYLELANSAFSWQAVSFLRTAMFRSTVFVGVSLSDPNMSPTLYSRPLESELKLSPTPSNSNWNNVPSGIPSPV